MIIFNLPFAGQVPNLAQIPERMHIQNVLAIAAVKTLDKAVLLRFAGLDTTVTNPVCTAKLSESSADKLGAVVTAYIHGKTSLCTDDIKAANYPCGRQARINLDRQAFAVKIVNHIKCPETVTIAQTVTHKINTPYLIGSLCIRHRFSLRYLYTLLPAVFELKLVFLIHTVNLFVIPLEALSSNRVKYLRKTTPGAFTYY